MTINWPCLLESVRLVAGIFAGAAAWVIGFLGGGVCISKATGREWPGIVYLFVYFIVSLLIGVAIAEGCIVIGG